MEKIGSTEDLADVTHVQPHEIEVDLNKPNDENFTPLHAAVCTYNESAVNYLLLKKKVDPNKEGANGLRPLEMVCKFGIPRILGILLKDKRTELNYCHPKRGSALH